jgi:CRP/FNR family cyclic AMP-dependent transcriptional regulator
MDRGLVEEFSAGQAIFREGEPADRLYILRRGRVELVKRGENGESLLKVIAAPGEFFGEMALIDGKPRSASALALDETLLLAVDGPDFKSMLETNGSFALKIVKALIERIRRSNFQLTDLVDTPIKDRIARAIADYALNFGERANLDARYVGRNGICAWLNGHIGISREEAEAAIAKHVEAGELRHSEIAVGGESFLTATGAFIRANDRRFEEPEDESPPPRSQCVDEACLEPAGLLGSDEPAPIRYEAGKVVFREGDGADRMFILLEGAVELTKRSAKGETTLKTVSTSNDFFGEMALIDGKRRSATATTTAPTRLMAVDGASFERLLSTNGSFASKIVKALSERIRRMNNRLADLIDTPPRERIARAIADYAARFGPPEERRLAMPELRKWLNGHIGASYDEVNAAVFRHTEAGEISYSAEGPDSKEEILVPEEFMARNDRRHPA